jgi:site-specific recombinase XerD
MMYIEEYLESLRQARLSASTIEAYVRELEQFQTYCRTARLRVTQVTPKVVLDYLSHRQALRPSEGEAVRRRMSALSTYFRYVEMVTNGRIRSPLAPLRRPRRQRPEPKPVDDVVLETLLAGISVARDKAIVMLFASSGLRLSELVSLNRGSVQIEITPHGEGAQVIGIGRVIGKGQKEREFLVDLPTLKQLHAYEQERGQDDIPALFLSSRKKRMSQRTVQHMLWKWCCKLGVEPIHPHALRHTASSTWHRLGMDTLKISRLLGHSSVAVTDRYIKPDAARLKAEYYASMEVLARRGAPALPAPDDKDTQSSP